MKKEAKEEGAAVKKRTRKAHLELMKKFLGEPVTNVRFFGNKISLTYLGCRISDKCVVRKNPHVGEWSRRRKEVIVDKNFDNEKRKKEFRSLCVHEAVERFLVKTYGLNTDNEAHVVATRKEKEFLKSEKGNWRSHQMHVFWDWHKQGEK